MPLRSARMALARLGGVGAGFCAAFLAFVVVGGLTAIVIAEPYNEDKRCWPYYIVFGLVRSECEDRLAQALWYGTVEMARFFVVVPSLAVVFFKTALESGRAHWLAEALVWSLWSVPVALMVWVGFRHWRGRFPVVAWLLLVAFIGQVAFVGLDM